MDKLTSMNVFVRVAKAGSFAGAARDLGISRAMATKHIMQLESELNTRLFNRTTRNISLTEVGQSYLERCQQVLLDVEEMEAAVTHMQREPRGVLKISAPSDRRDPNCAGVDGIFKRLPRIVGGNGLERWAG